LVDAVDGETPTSSLNPFAMVARGDRVGIDS